MKRKIYSWIMILPLLLCLVTACGDEDLVKQSAIGDEEVWAELPFGIAGHTPVKIDSRTTYDLRYESMVRNLYVFVFVGNERVYGHFFDENNFTADVDNDVDSWTVNNKTDNSTSTFTTGTVRMKVPVVTDGGAEIVMIANLDLDFINVSHERLSLVSNKSELENMVVSLNQEFPNRNAGYFIMTGSKDGVTIANDGTITVPDNTIELYRLDAKVEVNVRINPNEESEGQKVEEFTPESWQVINLPKSSLLLSGNSPLLLVKDSYFDLSPKNFETTENEVIDGNATGGILYGFSFYTLENQRSAEKKKSVGGNYHNRDRRNKYLDDSEADNYGTYNTEDGLWEYAPELATYLVIRGELKMVIDPGLTSEQHLIADVTYYVHLGDFAKDKDNYDIVRNTHYKYTINIKGVENIEVEVDTSNDNIEGITENQPGAMGHLYEAEEDIYTFDAHFGQRVYTIRASEVDVENMTWYVRTPFGRQGIPLKDASGNEIYNDLDYQWVEFMLNDKEEGSNEYLNSNKQYPSDKSTLMTVIEMLNQVKTEVVLWRQGKESLFDKNGEIKFTVFVNEFYYDENPMNPNDPDILWKKFVNQPNRLMHILCKNNRSKDGDSSITGSILTIRQRSIQTPFNINPAKTDLTTAWGCETVDEMKNQAWFYSPNEDKVEGDGGADFVGYEHIPKGYTAQNTSKTDGLYNTACLLNLVNGKLKWSTFLDFSDKELQLKEEYNAGLYSVFLRNRDLDGDDTVDPEELRWYIASLDQLCGLFLGDQGLHGDAQLYPISASREPNTPVDSGSVFDGVYPWRLHVVSSTAWKNKAGYVPTVVWAEEGASTGQYQSHWTTKAGYSPIRCVRNLGMVDANMTNIGTAGANFPSNTLVQVSQPSSTVYRFDFTNMNEESRRYYTTRELAPGDEYSVMSRLYNGFETGELKNIGITYHDANNGLKHVLENGESLAPTGYRVPNVREGVVMYLYCTENANWSTSWGRNNDGFLVSNFYSFGEFGAYEPAYDGGFYTWTIFADRVTIGDKSNTNVRFVKDWNP